MECIVACIVFFCGELISITVFPILTHYLGPKGVSRWDLKSISKGILERLVLFTALLHNYPQILIAFSAMKLGTRLHHEKNGSDISNNYFLVGNLTSIFIAILAVIITKKIWAIW